MAMAPEQTGIGIRRHFTNEAVDPYDEVVWERRDARITNFRDGTVAFEQRDVEFPVVWSQNATNIVAQKYFRGHLGSPERESSLRQVINRVVDTITAWGRKDGYFTDDDEAEAFRYELKYLILHQKAAFNSPVWFNIGVKGEPQQASACQPYDAPVSTPAGLVPIGRLVDANAVGTKVFDAGGVTRVVAVKNNGRRVVLRIHARTGHTLDVTSDHLVWRQHGDDGRFVPAGQLSPGDQLEWHRTESGGDGQVGREETAKAAVAGWLQADGFITREAGSRGRDVSVEAVVVSDAERAWVDDAIAVAFPGAQRREDRVSPDQPGADSRRIRITGGDVGRFVEEWGLTGRTIDAAVPARLFTAPLPVVAAYLRSLFQAEGYLSVRRRKAVVGLAMASEQVVRGIQSLLLRFGIFSKVRFIADGRPSRHGYWVLNVSVAADGRRFAEEIGFVDPAKASELEAAAAAAPDAAAPAMKSLTVDRIEMLGEMPVYDIQTESGEYLSGNIRVHNCFILSVDDTMRSILNWYVEEGTIFKGGSGAGVNLSAIRSSKEQLKGGGSASGPVSFMRGADASAGTIKCLHAETPIATDRGVVPIRAAQVGNEVLTRYGYRRIEAVHDNGIRSLVRVRTELGDEFLCTPEHKLRVRSRIGEQWRQAGELREDDYLILDLSHHSDGSIQALAAPEPRRTRETRHELPSQLDESFALWLGWVFGDGSITTRPASNFVAVQIGDQDGELVRRYERLTRAVFGSRVHLYADRHADRPDASASVRLSSTQIIRFLETNGLRKGRAAELRIPARVQASPPAVRAAFLSGLFEADGHIGNGYPTLSTVSRGLALDVHRTLLSIGIPSKVSIIDDRRAAMGKHPVHTVRIVGREGVRRFAKQVGFISDRKQELLERAVARKEASPFESQWFLPHVANEFTAMWEESPRELKRALAPYCRYATPRRLSLLRTRRLLEQYHDQLFGAPFATFAAGDELYVRATVEPAGEGPTFDLTVDDVHEYLVNNIVVSNSGGKTRRAAKMVILNVDHPDVEDFIWCKTIEERKARVLSEAGFDMDLDGKDSHSMQYQNANNSVRVTDEFMQAVIDDADWHLRAVTTGDILKTVKARDLFRQISQAAWECADPGVQYDTTINRWHTASNTARINASNPCFPGDARVHTDKGLVRFAELIDRVRLGETFGVYTHEATNPDAPSERLEITTPEAFMITGLNEILKLRFDNGMELRCTPNHRIFTVNRGYVAASDLVEEDQVKTLDLPAPAIHADRRLPVSTDVRDYETKGDWSRALRLPEKWTEEFAHYLGWLLGDGCISGDVVTTVYGGDDDQTAVLPAHLELLAWMNGDRAPKPSEQANGTVQLRQSRRAIARFLEALGVTHLKAAEKVVPWAVEQAPPEAVGAFLRGLFDADGCVYNGRKSRYVGLGSASHELLRGVQTLLTTFGIGSRIYETRGRDETAFQYARKDGSVEHYAAQPMYDLRISGHSIAVFAEAIGFKSVRKQGHLQRLLAEHRFYAKPKTVRLVARIDDGVELTYNLSEPRNHSYIVNGLAVRNCSEYMHLDNSACNLASLNLLTFLEEGGRFDVEGFRAAVEVVFTAQEILVGNADYPTGPIGENARRFRQLGLGYANLGAMLMALGLPYDSDGGRAWAGAITSLMTGHAYATSARTASRMGPFAGYSENREPMNRVLRMHRDEVAKIDEEMVSVELLSAAQESWDSAVELSEVYGVRNSQASVLAPTGTIGLMMDCDTTGVEPDLGLCKTKKLVGGGTMTIVNQTVPRALRRLGYAPEQVAEIIAYIDENKSIVGAPYLSADHMPVFACSMGDNTIHYLGHVKMMGAVQPFVSGAISKTVNVPEDVTVEDVEQLHIDAWNLGVKAIAIYRDNCKVAQPLATTKKETKAAALTTPVERLVETVIVKEPVREKLPRTRASKTFSFRVADCHGYVTVGEYEDGRPGEIFLRVAKQGSTLAGIMDAFAISVSHGLQYGVPLKAFVDMYTNMRFEPAGMTDDPDIRFASSLVDYIFRRLAVEYLPFDDRAELGILTIDERMQPTLPGVEEQVTPTSTGSEVVPDPAPALPAAVAASPAVDTSPAPQASDAPYCYQCGMVMQRAGACFVCSSCGTTSGCS